MTADPLGALLASLPPAEVELVVPRLLLAEVAKGAALDPPAAEYLRRFFERLGIGPTTPPAEVRARAEGWAEAHPVSPATLEAFERTFGGAPMPPEVASLFGRGSRPAPTVAVGSPSSLLGLRASQGRRRAT